MADKFQFCHQAMRLGSTFRKQGYRNESMTAQEFGCALRAVADAIGSEGVAERKYLDIRKRFPILDLIVEHPVTQKRSDLGGVCANLNDVYRWPRERIADFVGLHEQV